jgi:hypothetical protein
MIAHRVTSGYTGQTLSRTRDRALFDESIIRGIYVAVDSLTTSHDGHLSSLSDTARVDGFLKQRSVGQARRAESARIAKRGEIVTMSGSSAIFGESTYESTCVSIHWIDCAASTNERHRATRLMLYCSRRAACIAAPAHCTCSRPPGWPNLATSWCRKVNARHNSPFPAHTKLIRSARCASGTRTDTR